MLMKSWASAVIESAGAGARLRSRTRTAPAQRGARFVRAAPHCKRLLRVVIADDCHDTVDSLAVLMRWWGHDVRVAYSGAAVVEIASDFPPDVFLLDIAMPQLNGLVLARQLRGQPLFADALVVAITGYADAAHRRLGADAGFDLYLVKPVEPSTLERLLKLEKARRAKAASDPGTPIAANFQSVI